MNRRKTTLLIAVLFLATSFVTICNDFPVNGGWEEDNSADNSKQYIEIIDNEKRQMVDGATWKYDESGTSELILEGVKVTHISVYCEGSFKITLKGENVVTESNNDETAVCLRSYNDITITGESLEIRQPETEIQEEGPRYYGLSLDYYYVDSESKQHNNQESESKAAIDNAKITIIGNFTKAEDILMDGPLAIFSCKKKFTISNSDILIQNFKFGIVDDYSPGDYAMLSTENSPVLSISESQIVMNNPEIPQSLEEPNEYVFMYVYEGIESDIKPVSDKEIKFLTITNKEAEEGDPEFGPAEWGGDVEIDRICVCGSIWISEEKPQPEPEVKFENIEAGEEFSIVINTSEKIGEVCLYKVENARTVLNSDQYSVRPNNESYTSVTISFDKELTKDTGNYKFEIQLGNKIVSDTFVVESPSDPDEPVEPSNNNELPVWAIVLIVVIAMIIFAGVAHYLYSKRRI